ncbi:hypothetical protein BDW22DRAFT_1359164 [Trametopsis cervina]|nr:hypothetical protein BDW22DRAFT_1359164 [Trametopsis cervina]
MYVDATAYSQARLERNAYLATACFITYEYFLQLGNEYELFWKKRWTFGKCLFLWSRYYSLVFNIYNAYAFLNGHPSFHDCTSFFHWQDTGAALQVVTTHIILELRIYAMYGSTRVMFCVCMCLAILEAIVFGVLFGVQNPNLIGTNNPAPGVFICADGDPPHGHWVTYYYMSILIIESILLGLSVYRGFQNHRSGLHGGLMGALLRDSVIYFVIIFCVYTLNMIMWFVNVLTLDEFATSFAFTISSVLANRLLITVREKYYFVRGEMEETKNFTSMQFRTRTGEVPPGTGDAIGLSTAHGTTSGRTQWGELTTFDDVDLDEAEQYSEGRGF